MAALPRLTLPPGTAGSGYQGLRREPEPGHLATIDAVAEALGALEGDAARYAPMRAAFAVAVERQLARARGADRAPRHRPGAAARDQGYSSWTFFPSQVSSASRFSLRVGVRSPG